MRTQTNDPAEPGTPWLEYFHDREGQTLKFELLQFPFTIGRDPAVDLPVDSTRVSRRHAEIIHTPDDRYVLHDLKSTNGTSVNGQIVVDTELNDGDVIVVADSELTFFGGASSSRVAATQVMAHSASNSSRAALELIGEIRRLQESLVHRSISSHFQPIVDLATQDVFGYQVVRVLGVTDSSVQPMTNQIEQIECHLVDRVNQQYRLVAAELAMQWDTPFHLFFPLQVTDVSFDSLPDDFHRLHDMLNGRHRLVAEIPETAVCDIPYFRRFVDRLHEYSVKVTYAGFQGTASQIEDWDNVPPDYLKLAPALVHGISRASGGWRKTQLLLDAAHKLGCEVIAAGVQDDADSECLAELGCRYGSGDRYGKAQPIDTWTTARVAMVPAT